MRICAGSLEEQYRFLLARVFAPNSPGSRKHGSCSLRRDDSERVMLFSLREEKHTETKQLNAEPVVACYHHRIVMIGTNIEQFGSGVGMLKAESLFDRSI